MPLMREFEAWSTKSWWLSNSISQMLTLNNSGMEPLTPQDIAEVIVFNVTRRQNVVVADSLIFPTSQVSQLLALLFQKPPTKSANTSMQGGTGAANMYRKTA